MQVSFMAGEKYGSRRVLLRDLLSQSPGSFLVPQENQEMCFGSHLKKLKVRITCNRN